MENKIVNMEVTFGQELSSQKLVKFLQVIKELPLLKGLSINLHYIKESHIHDFIGPFILELQQIDKLSLCSAAKYSVHPTYKTLIKTLS